MFWYCPVVRSRGCDRHSEAAFAVPLNLLNEPLFWVLPTSYQEKGSNFSSMHNYTVFWIESGFLQGYNVCYNRQNIISILMYSCIKKYFPSTMQAGCSRTGSFPEILIYVPYRGHFSWVLPKPFQIQGEVPIPYRYAIWDYFCWLKKGLQKLILGTTINWKWGTQINILGTVISKKDTDNYL